MVKEAHLLPETDTWSGIEWHKDERVGCEVSMETVIKEAVRIKNVRYIRQLESDEMKFAFIGADDACHQGPRDLCDVA